MECDNVDTTETITHVGLCAGYGGIELGLKRVLPTLRTVALCEIEAFAIANLVAKMEAGLMDAAPVWTDLKTFPWESFRDRVDLLTGGYPCQPFSAAGKRAGKDDPRHLWPWIADGIAAMRPKLCLFENVEGHISLGLSDVIEDLAGMGYRTTWGIFSAAECGAPHQRKRVFIMAHCKDKRLSGWTTKRWNGKDWPNGDKVWDESGRQGDCHTELADTKLPGSARFERFCSELSLSSETTRDKTCACGINKWPSRPNKSQHSWEPPRVVDKSTNARLERGEQSSTAWPTTKTITASGRCRDAESTLGGDVDGATSGLDHAELSISYDNRTDELRLLGNGVVPATAAVAFTTLLNEQRNTRHLA
jgi:site-specific DNA-cytosine methylase